MWIEQLPDGKVKFRERYTDYLTGKEKKASVTMPKDTPRYRKEAQRILQEKIDNHYKPKAIEEFSLSDLRKSFLAEKKVRCKKSTYRYNDCMTNIVCKALGNDTLISKINIHYVLDNLIDPSKNNSTINSYITTFKEMMRYAYKRDMILDISWISKLEKLPDPAKRQKLQDKFLEQSELKTLINSIDNQRYRYIFEVLALSGMRIGELTALNIDDVDYESHYIHIYKTYDSAEIEVYDTPKTPASVRDIYIQPELETALRHLTLCQKEYAMRYGIRTNYLIFTRNGSRINYKQLDAALSKYSINSIGRSISLHVLRHTHTSLLAEHGFPLLAIKDRLGHDDSDITERIYLHVTQNMKQKNNEILSQVNIL